MNIKITLTILITAALLTAAPGCKSSKAVKGGAIGAGAGGAVGAMIGNHYDNTALGAIIGATVGGATGAIIGRRMDKQAEELEQEIKNAEVVRVEEGIRVTFDSGLMFAVNQSELTPATRANLDELAKNLNEHELTEVLLEGHTDSSGKDDYNQTLSEKRAKAVSNHLIAKGVDASRLTVKGYGESQPIAENDTAEGKQKNRRVEVAIYASEEMKEAAANGSLE